MGREAERPSLFYILAFVPSGASNRYFVLSQAEANAEIAFNEEACQRRARLQNRVASAGFEGIPFAAADKYGGVGAWEKLPR